jgi:zinc transport system substrate-binding protein
MKLALLISLLFWAGCTEQANTTKTTQTIYTGIPPVLGIVTAIAGPSIRVNSLVATGQDPHHFIISPSVMAGVARADLYISTGFGFESKLFDKLKSIEKGPQYLLVSQQVEPTHHHNANPLSDHHSDPHQWLSPAFLTYFISKVSEHLGILYPNLKSDFISRADSLIREVQEFDVSCKSAIAPFAHFTVFTTHPFLGEFAAHYNLSEHSLEEEGSEVSPAHFAEFLTQFKKLGANTLIVTPGLSPKEAERLKSETQGQIININPLDDQVIKTLNLLCKHLVQDFSAREKGHDHH